MTPSALRNPADGGKGKNETNIYAPAADDAAEVVEALLRTIPE